MTTVLVRVDTGYAIAGFILRDDKVKETAPILYQVRGMNKEQAVAYMNRRRWRWEMFDYTPAAERRRP